MSAEKFVQRSLSIFNCTNRSDCSKKYTDFQAITILDFLDELSIAVESSIPGHSLYYAGTTAMNIGQSSGDRTPKTLTQHS